MARILLVNDTRLVGHHGSSAVVDVIFAELAARGVEPVSHLTGRIDLETIDGRFDAVVINGEGAMHGGKKNSEAFSRLGERLQRQGVPAFLINTVYQEEKPEIVRRMPSFTRIYCREAMSVDRLAGQGVEARLCPDLTFALPMPDGIAWTPGERIVVLDTTMASKNRVLFRFARENALAFQPMRYAPQLLDRASVDNLRRNLRFHALQAWYRLFPGLYYFGRYGRGVRGRDAFLHRLTDGTKVVVAARFHGVCLCLKLGVPFLAIASNTHKIEGMLADAGLSHRLIAMQELGLAEIEARAAWAQADEAKRLAYVAAAQASIAAMFDDIVETARKGRGGTPSP